MKILRELRSEGRPRFCIDFFLKYHINNDKYISLKPAPKSPELRLEPMNCTTITVQWQQDSEDTAAIQGYKLYYKEEGQQENGPILLDASDLEYTVSGLGEYIKYSLTVLEDNKTKGCPRDLKCSDM